MLPAIQIDDETTRVTDAKVIAAALLKCRYRLPGAAAQVWRQTNWQVVEQAYDLPDVYISYIEVRAYTAHAFVRIRCPQHDLYWLYLLGGEMGITTPDGHKPLIKTIQNHYRVSYLPAGRYGCRFGEGTHRIFYVVHKATALFREDSPELGVQADVFAAVKARLATHATGEPLSMLDGSGNAIRRFLHTFNTTYLRRKQAIEHLSLELVFIAHDSMRATAGGLKTAADWAEQIKQYIDACVTSGMAVDVHSVADRFSVSAGYARKLFKAHHGEAIGGYITKRKLELAAELLREGDPPSRVARYLGWTPAYFSRAYRAKFGRPPGGGGNTRA